MKFRYIIDLRSKELFRKNRLFYAINVPIDDIHTLIQTLQKCISKDDNILVYCQRGITSKRGAFFLRKYGFNNVTELKGGICAGMDAKFFHFKSHE